MPLHILAFIASLAAAIAASMPVSVHYGEAATFSWPLPAKARGQLVKVVNPYGVPVLDWAPNCTVTSSTFYTHRIRSSCKDASQLTFTLLGITWPDEGSYTCVTSSNVRIEDCGQNLTLFKVLPKILIELSTPDTVAMETKGKYLNLTCVVTEASPPVPEDSYSWSYLPSPQGQLQHLAEKSSTLNLGPLTREDSGLYFCQAWNDPDNKWNIRPVTVSFALNTSCLDAFLHADISSQAVVEKDRHGYKAVFQLVQHPGLILVQHPNTSIITDWHPPCNFSINKAFKHRVTNMSCDPCKRMMSFSLVSVMKRDLGLYQCYAGWTDGPKIDSCSVELISQVPIQVHMEPLTPDAVVKASEGDHLTLTCVVTQAFPPVPEDGYSWSFLSSPRRQRRHLVEKTNTLTLGPVTREDSGQYFCQARNDQTIAGNISPGIASVIVNVSYLGLLKPSPDLKVSKDDPVTLTCNVDSKPTARLAWVVGGQEVRHVTANEDHYVLERAACSDSKTYTCRASNPDLPDIEKTACITLTVNCEQASDGHNWWQITLVVLVILVVIIMLAVGVGVLVCCIRRQGRKPSKNPPGDESRMKSQPTIKEQHSSPSQESNTRTAIPPEAVGERANLDDNEAIRRQLVPGAMERPTSVSQQVTIDQTTRTELPTEVVAMCGNLDFQEATCSLLDDLARERPTSVSQEPITDEATMAGLLDAEAMGEIMDDQEQTSSPISPLILSRIMGEFLRSLRRHHDQVRETIESRSATHNAWW